jgi:hypothetical protein
LAHTARSKATRSYRTRLAEKGMARFEVIGRSEDRDLLRSLARRLAEEGPAVEAVRWAISTALRPPPARKGGILAALRASPLVGADVPFERDDDLGREAGL